MVGLIALVALAGGVAAAYANANKEIRENNDAMIESANKTQKEVDADNKLYESYTKLYDAYEDGSATKEDLAKETDNLVKLLGKERVEVAKLTGDYESLNNEILQAQQAAAQKGLDSARSELTAATSNVENKAKEGRGYQSGDRYKIN